MLIGLEGPPQPDFRPASRWADCGEVVAHVMAEGLTLDMHAENGECDAQVMVPQGPGLSMGYGKESYADTL